MGDGAVDALFVSEEEGFATTGGQIDGFANAGKITFLQHAVIDQREHYGVGDNGSEFFHHIQCERGAAEAGLVVKADVGIKSCGIGGERAVAGKEAVGE